ncbi:MAG: Rpn family recombination-promoting nuclease/putative transposase [Eubacteriales bacterium]
MKQTDWESLGIEDDFLFGKVMKNLELCRELLEIILDIKIARIEYPNIQKTIKPLYQGKGIRLDVYVADEEHTVYNIEMQTYDSYELPQRTRYYQGIMDMESLQQGAEYEKLNQSYIIFICTFDLFRQGRVRYTFEQRCVEDTKIRLEDGATKIFLNTKGMLGRESISEDLRAFLEYIEGNESENSFVRKLIEEIIEVKNNEKLRGDYMNQVVRDRLNRNAGYSEGMSQGISQGISQERVRGIIELIRRKHAKGLTIEQISEHLELEESYVKKVIELIEEKEEFSDIEIVEYMKNRNTM